MNNKGFSLIEMLIAIAVFGVLLSALTAFYISHNRQYSVQSQIAAMHDNARSTMDFVVRMLRNGSVFTSPPYGSDCNHKVQFISFLGTPAIVQDGITAQNTVNSLETGNVPDELKVLFVEELDLSVSPLSVFSCSRLMNDAWLLTGDAWWISIDNEYYFVAAYIDEELNIHEAHKHEFRIYSGTDGPNTFGYHKNPDSGTIDPFALNITCFEVIHDENKFEIEITAETQRVLPSTGQKGAITLGSTVKPRNIY